MIGAEVWPATFAMGQSARANQLAVAVLANLNARRGTRRRAVAAGEDKLQDMAGRVLREEDIRGGIRTHNLRIRNRT